MTHPLDSLAITAAARTPVYTERGDLERIKAAGRTGDPRALRAAAEQFESVFLQMMLKSMRDATPGDPLFGGSGTRMYRDLFDRQISVQMAGIQGLGLAEVLMRQLAPPGAPAAPGDGAGPHAPGAPLAAPRRGHLPAVSGTRAVPAGTAATEGEPTPLTRPVAPEGEAAHGRAGFVQSMWPHAERAGRRLGVDPGLLVAQAALETGWGRSVIRDASGRSSHNLFGIKAGGGWRGPTVSRETLEFEHGSLQRVRAPFRAYASPAESFADYAALVSGSGRYAEALRGAADPETYIRALHRGGYATDPAYADKVLRVRESVRALQGTVPA